MEVAAEASAGAIERAAGLIEAGGPVVAILLAMSVVALAVILLKLWQFRAVRLFDRAPARRIVALHRGGRTREALDLAEAAPGPVARLLALAIRGRLRRELPEALVREEVMQEGADLVEGLRSHLRVLELVAALAPLLGLFGTVLGMIDAFRQLELAGSHVDPAILSGGIWIALLTTAVGLAIAIPVVAILGWFERVIERTTHEMESAATRIFTEDLDGPPAYEPHHGQPGIRAPELAAHR